MKLLFTIPEGNPHNIFSSDLIAAWLKYNRIFFGKKLEVSYNTVYNFYDCYIYRFIESESTWEVLFNDLSDLEEVTHIVKTWSRDIHNDKVDVIRFWIHCYPENDIE